MHVNAPGTSITGPSRWLVSTLDVSPSAAEAHAAHLIAQPFDFFRVGGAPKALGQSEEFLLLSVFSFRAVIQ
jgi:hypothetical protein